MNLSTIVKQSKDQVSCCLNDEVAILNLKSTMYFGLDELGAYIWQVLNEPRPVSEICSMVVDRYEVDTTRCTVDVLNFMAKLEKVGLIELLQAEEARGSASHAAHTETERAVHAAVNGPLPD
jgi:hypothetical protein